MSESEENAEMESHWNVTRHVKLRIFIEWEKKKVWKKIAKKARKSKKRAYRISRKKNSFLISENIFSVKRPWLFTWLHEIWGNHKLLVWGQRLKYKLWHRRRSLSTKTYKIQKRNQSFFIIITTIIIGDTQSLACPFVRFYSEFSICARSAQQVYKMSNGKTHEAPFRKTARMINDRR